MPPQNPENPGPLDPNRIDVSLSLMGEEGATAITALTAQISLLHSHLAQFGGMDPSSVARAQAAVARATSTSPGGVIPSGPSAMASNVAEATAHVQGIVEGRTPPQPAQAAPTNEEGLPSSRSSIADPDAQRDLRLANLSARKRLQEIRKEPETQGLGSVIDRWNEVYAARERQQASRRLRTLGRTGDFETPGFDAGGIGDELSTGASLPSGGVRGGGGGPGEVQGVSGSELPGWYRSLTADPVAYERMQEGLRIPQIGEFTIQNKLEMGRNLLANRAFRRYQTAVSDVTSAKGFEDLSPEEQQSQINDITSGQNEGRAAGLLHQASQNTAYIYAGQRELRRFRQHVANINQGIQQPGIQMGYDPGASVTFPGTNVGFRLPDFSSGGAFREGLRQQLTQWRLQAQAGISGTQAKEIVSGVNAGGFSGAEGMRLATGAVAPLVRQGLDPTSTAQIIAESVRNGNASVKDVADTLDHLGETARATRQSLDQTVQGLEEFTQTSESLGALRVEGLKAGRQLMDATGLTGGQAATAIQSPLVQAQGMFNYGVLPNAFSTLPAAAQGQSIYSAVNMAMRATSSFGGHTIHTPWGDVSGREEQITQAAQFAGIPRETFQRLWTHRFQGRALTSAGGLLDKYAKGQALLDKGHDKDQKHARNIPGFRGDHYIVPEDPHSPGAEAQAQFEHQNWPAIQKALESGARGLHGKEARDWKSAVAKISHEHGKERVDDALKFIKEKSKTDIPDQRDTVHLKFTGPAAKWFEQVKNLPDPAKQKANAGGENLPSQILHGAGEVIKFAHNLPGSPI